MEKTEKKFKGVEKPVDDKKKGNIKKFSKGKEDGKFKGKFPYKGKNNIDWRTADSTMTELVARLPFGLASGLPQHLHADRVTQSNSVRFVVPGILSIRTRLGVGGNTGSLNYNSAINLAARKIYSYVRHANSGSKNYESADLGMYLIALQQALGLLGWCQRLYRIVNEYSATNRYTPVRLMKIMGVNADDFIANQPQLKYLIAWFGRAIGALAFPDLNIMKASYEAYKWVIRDNDSPKEQFYLLDAKGFGKFDPVLTAQGGGITYTTQNAWASPTSPITFTGLYAYVHEIMDVLLSDEDCGIISGDILKAYKDTGLFKVEAFGDYDVFIKDDELLQQIHNAHLLNEQKAKLADYHQVVGGTNTAQYIAPSFTCPAATISGGNACTLSHYTIIDAFSKVPEAKEVVNCMILNPQYDLGFVSGSNQVYVNDATIAFDLHLPVEAWADKDIADTYPVSVSGLMDRYIPFTTNPTIPNIAILSAFDWHPFTVYAIVYQGTPTSIDLVGDKQNFRVFEGDVGTRIHENSLLSLMNFQDNNFY